MKTKLPYVSRSASGAACVSFFSHCSRWLKRRFFVTLGCALGAASALTAADLPLPQKVGETFLVDDFDFKVTKLDLGFNYFGGNMGTLNNPPPSPTNSEITSLSLSPESFGTVGGSLRTGVNFTNQPSVGPFGGAFIHLFGLSDTKVRLDGLPQEPTNTTTFPGSYLNFNNFFGEMATMQNRTIDRVLLEARLEAGSPQVSVKLELRDAGGLTIYARRLLTTTNWVTVSLIRADFSRGDVAAFDWTKVKFFSAIVERRHVVDEVDNPVSSAFLLDNVRLADDDGLYPNLAAIAALDGSLRPEFARAFLDLVRARSFQYFLDFDSTDPRTGGAIQDRGPFADLMSIGGVGFQLSAYVVGAERGYIARTNSADCTVKLLRALYNGPQGTNRVGVAGYRGFFYHFWGIDGLRKQNFDFTATTDLNETLNTVEVSPIDTALALAGVVVSGRYFDRNDPIENEIRALAEAIFARVDWPFMLQTLSDGKKQFALAWKPNETRDDTNGLYGRFLLNDGYGTGQFASKSVLVSGVPTEAAATLDYYTDEGLLIILLAMASPDPAHRVGRTPWDDLIRTGTPFVKTYPGSLFTYQFFSVWLDTFRLGRDNHAVQPLNFFDNTRTAILTARQYAINRPLGLPSPAADFWSWSACDGAFDSYFAETAPPLALAKNGSVVMGANLLKTEGENMLGDGTINWQSNASNVRTRYLLNGQQAQTSVNIPAAGTFEVQARYSNDGPSDTVTIRVDGNTVGSLTTSNTLPPGGNPGDGWNNFITVTNVAQVALSAGNHEVVVGATTDTYGVEIDWVGLNSPEVLHPLDSGVLTVYGVGSSMVHAPTEALSALWAAARLDLNQDGKPDLFHPRFGFADAFCKDITDASVVTNPGDSNVLRRTGAWLNHTGFAIDHGPMLLLLDNYLSGNFMPKLFMSHARIQDALATVFPSQRVIRQLSVTGSNVALEWAGFDTPVVVETKTNLAAGTWTAVTGLLTTNQVSLPRNSSDQSYFRLRYP